MKGMTFTDIATSVEVGLDGSSDYLAVKLDDAIRKCVERIRKTRGKAEVAVSLRFAMKDSVKVHIGASIATKLPEVETLPTEAFVDRDGVLVEEDPYQQVFEFGAAAERKKGEA